MRCNSTANGGCSTAQRRPLWLLRLARPSTWRWAGDGTVAALCYEVGMREVHYSGLTRRSWLGSIYELKSG